MAEDRSVSAAGPWMEVDAFCHDCSRQHHYHIKQGHLVDAMGQWATKHHGHNIGFAHPKHARVLPFNSRFQRRMEWFRRLIGAESSPGWLLYDHNADVKMAYAASSNLTVTNLAGLASSSDWTAGWESGAIDNTSNLYLDYRVTSKITLESSGLAAAEVRKYLVGMLDDSTWPDVFDGTEGTETVTDTEVRDAICLLGAMTVTDTTASQVYYLDCPSSSAVFSGNQPAKFVIFITQSTTTTLETTGQQVTVKGSYRTVA